MSARDDHYLKRELAELVQRVPSVFTFLQESSLDGVWFWDLQNPENEYMDRRFWEVLGYDPDLKEHLASEWQALIHPEDLEVASRNFDAHCADPSHPYDQVVRYRHRDGSTVWVRCRGLAIRDGSGTPVRMLGVHNDVTEIKRAEEDAVRRARELHDANEAARAASRAKSEFLANMSHEIRTPLNAVIGMTEAVLRSNLDERQRERLQVAMTASESLLRIINDILDLAKIESGRLELEAEPFELRDALDEAIRPLEYLAHEKDLELARLIAPGVPARVVGDAGRLRQVLINLIGNAIKFTEHGEVVVRVQRESGEGDVLRFSVRDTGVGAPPEMLERMFESFEQGDVSASKRYQGTGLGLAICRRLVHMMGGAIRAESSPGKGSLFEFTARLGEAPSASARTPTEARAGAAVEPALRRLRILLAEDSEANQKVVAAMLQDTPYEITIAGNGRRAVDLAETEDFDLILMDVEMPELDGYGATQAIRAWESATGRPRTPIVAMTAHAMLGTREKCLVLGMDDYVAKPMRSDQLRAAIARTVQAASAR